MSIPYTIRADWALFNCPKCKSPLETNLADAGKNDTCPACRCSFQSPGHDPAAQVADSPPPQDWFHCSRCHHLKLLGGLCANCEPLVRGDLIKMVFDRQPPPADVTAFLERYSLSAAKIEHFCTHAFNQMIDQLCGRISPSDSEESLAQTAVKYAKSFGANAELVQTALARISSCCSAVRNAAIARQHDAERAQARHRLLQAISAGNFPRLNPNFVLKKNETLHFHFDDVAFKIPVRHSQKTSGYRTGGSIRIARGFWVNTSQYIPGITTYYDSIDEVDSGPLAITNQRIIFQGAKKSWTIVVKKIVDCSPYLNAISLAKESSSQNNKPYILCYDDQELFNVAMVAIISNAEG